MPKNRLDIVMVERGLVESRSLAQRLVMAGQVRVSGQVVFKPADKVEEQAEIVIDHGPRFVSRGGEKLEAALEAFGLVDLRGWICADVGASTGGFTDCLLQHGAKQVFAIDVGYGILHWKIRQDQRVTVMERTNARHVKQLPLPPQLVTVDASFISLKILLPVVSGWFVESGQVVALIKPQFEAGRQDAARGDGVIRDPLVHQKVLQEVLQSAIEAGYELHGLIQSPLFGPKGNTEFLVWLGYPNKSSLLIDQLIRPLFPEE
ncbi:MAG TPA: TlyA family RNA methyltransferase [Bellilinea sp.]|nr:TlyA family RNA methyltransferase [Bellilinea sp.]